MKSEVEARLSPQLLTVATLVLLLAIPACTPSGFGVGTGKILTWGKRGLGDGQFQKPRAITRLDDEVYIIDMTARIQVFDLEGNFKRSWKTPFFKNGKPCGISVSQDGQIMIADTHCYQVLFYSPEGVLDESRTIGGENGIEPGQFQFLTDVVQDSKGNFYVSEYGSYDRIQKFDPKGKYLLEWGGHGQDPGEFLRPQSMAVDGRDHLWICDASNHRIQIFDVSGDQPKFVGMWGDPGRDVGQLNYPYGIFFGPDDSVFICEFGNHRIQKFDLEGNSLGVWGEAGREEGQLHQPWASCIDEDGRIFILDSYNHRVQRFDNRAVK